MAKRRNITKHLAGAEDLILGKGPVTQTRQGIDYTVHALDVPFALDTTEEMQDLDIAVYTRARVYTSTTTYVDYIFDPDRTDGIPSNVVGYGSWILASSSTGGDQNFLEEFAILADGQTTVEFPNSNLAYGAIYVGSTDVDRGRLIETVDYTVTQQGGTPGFSAIIELLATYPAGTYCVAVSADVAGASQKDLVKSMTLAEAAASQSAKEGDSVIISDRGNGLFTYKTGETANGYNIVTASNGLFLVLEEDTGTINLLQWGAPANDIDDDQPAWQSAANTGKNVYLPKPYVNYRLESGVSAPLAGGNQRWYGDHRGGFYDTDGNATTVIKCIGDNGGAPFIDPPRDLKHLRFIGDAKQGECLTISSDGNFASNKNWENIIIEGFSIPVHGYNWFSMSVRMLAVVGNGQGILINPSDTPSDDGYFTATNWENVYIADNDSYGLQVSVPLGSKSFEWTNVVIERNGASANAQCSLTNLTVQGNSCYFEGTPTLDFARMNGCSLFLTNTTMNSVGEFNFTNNNNTLVMDGGELSGINNIANSSSVVIQLNEVFAPDFNPYLLGSNVRYGARNSTTNDNAASTERLWEVLNRPRLGKGLLAAKSTPIDALTMMTRTVTSTINAGASTRIAQNVYIEGLFSGSTGSVQVTLVPNGADSTGKELIFTASPNDTGDKRYVDIYAFNPTAVNVTLSHDITITVIKSEPV